MIFTPSATLETSTEKLFMGTCGTHHTFKSPGLYFFGMIAPIRMGCLQSHQTRWLALLPSSAPMAFVLAMVQARGLRLSA
jgi:hypothetical protein